MFARYNAIVYHCDVLEIYCTGLKLYIIHVATVLFDSLNAKKEDVYVVL